MPRSSDQSLAPATSASSLRGGCTRRRSPEAQAPLGLAGRRVDTVALYDYLWDCGVWLVSSHPSGAIFGEAALAIDVPGMEKR